MKSEKLKSFLKGVWAFCSYVFVPQRRMYIKRMLMGYLSSIDTRNGA